MTSTTTTRMAVAFVAFSLGCSSKPDDAPGERFEIIVGSLELSAITGADYTIAVTNSDGDPVWSESGLTSDLYGDGSGSLTYIGPCDAQKSPNRVTLTLDNLYETVGGNEVVIATSEWENPTPVWLDVPCLENEDTDVEFNLVIMRDADQGWFDIAVNFSDIFCSAKLDCDPDLLFDGPARSLTFIIGFACATGVDQNTWLYLDDYRLECSNDGWVTSTFQAINPNLGPGQHGALGTSIFEHAIYVGGEDFPDVDKCYWNNAIGVEESWLQPWNECRIAGRGTAATDHWLGLTSPGNTAYPIVQWSATIWDTTKTPKLQCYNHPLDGTPVGVATGYTDIQLDTGTPFMWARPCTTENVICDVRNNDVTVSGAAGGREFSLSVQLGGDTVTKTFPLPAGMTLESPESCCDGCCGGLPGP